MEQTQYLIRNQNGGYVGTIYECSISHVSNPDVAIKSKTKEIAKSLCEHCEYVSKDYHYVIIERTVSYNEIKEDSK